MSPRSSEKVRSTITLPQSLNQSEIAHWHATALVEQHGTNLVALAPGRTDEFFRFDGISITSIGNMPARSSTVVAVLLKRGAPEELTASGEQTSPVIILDEPSAAIRSPQLPRANTPRKSDNGLLSGQLDDEVRIHDSGGMDS